MQAMSAARTNVSKMLHAFTSCSRQLRREDITSQIVGSRPAEGAGCSLN